MACHLGKHTDVLLHSLCMYATRCVLPVLKLLYPLLHSPLSGEQGTGVVGMSGVWTEGGDEVSEAVVWELWNV